MNESSHVDGAAGLRILYVAYPLLPVSQQSAGGAEQVLWTLEREMHRRGHRTMVAACAGSSVSGEPVATGDPAESIDEFELRCEQQAAMLLEWVGGKKANEVDLIHDMSGSFWQRCQNVQVPLLATLHLPRSLYKQVNFSNIPSTVAFNCVSRAQTSEFRDVPRMLGVVNNGIAIDLFPQPAPQRDREYLLWIGRICEEKGTHRALDVAQQAEKKLIVAGAVYPFLYHQKYFAREVIPRLKRAGAQAKYVERPSFLEKIDLLRNAAALLITSDVNETSSVVAMEAAACGTPVIALCRGALPEVIQEGVTGFLVDDVSQMLAAISRVGEIDSKRSRAYAEQHYSAQMMARGYAELYGRVITEMRSLVGSTTAADS